MKRGKASKNCLKGKFMSVSKLPKGYFCVIGLPGLSLVRATALNAR